MEKRRKRAETQRDKKGQKRTRTGTRIGAITLGGKQSCPLDGNESIVTGGGSGSGMIPWAKEKVSLAAAWEFSTSAISLGHLHLPAALLFDRIAPAQLLVSNPRHRIARHTAIFDGVARRSRT